jgi:hypothetical protein
MPSALTDATKRARWPPRVSQRAGINKEVQGSVHSAFYNGYTLSQARALQRAGLENSACGARTVSLSRTRLRRARRSRAAGRRLATAASAC